MNRIYEELFILRPDVTEEEVDAIVEALRTVVTNTGGTVDKVEKWGVRKLAYRVEKRNEGFYVLLQFTSADPNLPREARTPPARERCGDEVHHRPHRREDEEDREAQEGP